jgi:hypothetical protein
MNKMLLAGSAFLPLVVAAPFVVGTLRTPLSQEHSYAGLSTSEWRREIKEWLAQANEAMRKAPDVKLAIIPEWPQVLGATLGKRDPTATLVVLDLLREDKADGTREEAISAVAGYVLGEPFVHQHRARILTIHSDGTTYTVVILRGEDRSQGARETSTDAYFFLLFDSQGRLRDQLCCSIDGRLNGWWTDQKFRADLLSEDQTDGAQLVTRYLGHEPRYYPGFPPVNDASYGHEIVHGGERRSFLWKKRAHKSGDRINDVNKELCRIAIQEGEFIITVPAPGVPVEDF